jgi:hypothetical protein
MRVAVWAVVCVLFSTTINAQEPPKEAVAKAWQRAREMAKEEHDQEVFYLDQRLKEANKNKAPDRFTIKKQLEAKRKEPPKDYLPLIRPSTIQQDDVGVLGGRIRILSVAGPSEALAIFEQGKADETVWVSGVDTSNMVSDTSYDLDRTWFWVSGTKTYTTVLGASKKVLILKYLDKPAR